MPADLKFEIDVEAISQEFGKLKDRVKEDLTQGVQAVASMTVLKSVELARDELNSLSQDYMDNLEFDNPEEGLWVVTLKAPAMWIEEGRKSGFQEELLNGKSSKTSKDGTKYAVIPFKHNKNPERQSAKAQELASQIKNALKQKGISWKKIEKDENGSPRIGRLHSFSIDNPRAKPHHKGALTQGISVYQSKVPGGSVRRDVMTFRVISEKHRSEGLWIHPGREGSKLLDKAFEWAMQTWEKDILPNILKDYE